MATPMPNLSICSSDICGDHGRLVAPPGGTKWWCTSMAPPRTFSFTTRSWPDTPHHGVSDAAPAAASAPRNLRLLVMKTPPFQKRCLAKTGFRVLALDPPIDACSPQHLVECIRDSGLMPVRAA